MKIEKIEIFKGTVYYKAPFKISLGTSEQSDEVLIKITDTEGNWGLGEAGPASRITGETQGTVIEASKLIASFLIGQENINSTLCIGMKKWRYHLVPIWMTKM